jgi:hypothetical protein
VSRVTETNAPPANRRDAAKQDSKSALPAAPAAMDIAAATAGAIACAILARRPLVLNTYSDKLIETAYRGELGDVGPCADQTGSDTGESPLQPVHRVSSYIELLAGRRSRTAPADPMFRRES